MPKAKRTRKHKTLTRRRYVLTRVPKIRLLESIRVLKDISARHPPHTQDARLARESIGKLEAELERRKARAQPNPRARRHNPTFGTYAQALKAARSLANSTGRSAFIRKNSILGNIDYLVNEDRPSREWRKRAVEVKPTRARRRNPRARRVALYAVKAGHAVLKYVGRGKFSRRGRARLFASHGIAVQYGRALQDLFPAALRGYRLEVK